MQVYQIDCDHFRKRHSGRRVEPPLLQMSNNATSSSMPAPAGGAAHKPAAIQMDTKSTAGAHNKNCIFTRVRGATAMRTFAEICSYMQEHAHIQKDQKQRFVRAHPKRIPEADADVHDVDAQTLAICFHALYAYKQ